MSGEQSNCNTVSLDLELPPGMLAELKGVAADRGVDLNTLIVLWLEFVLPSIKDRERERSL